MRILVTGATGYVGSRLIPELLARGLQVVGAYSTQPPTEADWVDQVAWVQMDALEADEVVTATTGIDAVYYLIHGLAGDDFREQDRKAAQIMADAAAANGVGRLIYLSGIIPQVDESELSEHLISRLEVERVFEAGRVPALTLRAAVIVGAGSTSFEVVRQMSEHLPVQPVPTWMQSLVQPIAIVDVVRLLVRALDGEPMRGHLDIGGPERVPYPELLRLYAAITGLRRLQLTVPGLPEPLVASLASRLTRVPTGTVESLIESLQHDMVATPGEIDRLREPDHHLIGLSESIRRALSDPDTTADGARADGDPLAASDVDPDWAGGWVSLDRDGVAVHRAQEWWSRALLGVREAGVRASRRVGRR